MDGHRVLVVHILAQSTAVDTNHNALPSRPINTCNKGSFAFYIMYSHYHRLLTILASKTDIN